MQKPIREHVGNSQQENLKLNGDTIRARWRCQNSLQRRWSVVLGANLLDLQEKC